MEKISEKINIFDLLIKNINNGEVGEMSDDNIIKSLNELAEINPKCLCEDDYEKLIKCLPLTLNNYNNLVLAAGYNVIASLCSDEIARHYFGEKITTCTVNILKSLLSSEINKIYFQECILQICRAIGNLCYYHEQNTKIALNEGCLLITMEILKTNTEENLQPVLIGLLLNLTHLDDYNYKFPENIIEELNLFGLQCMKCNNIKYKVFINLISVMINIVRKSSSKSKITVYEKCFLVDCLLEKYNMHIDIASICIKYIKQVSKTYNNYNWILNRKHKILVQILDKYEESQKDNEKLIVKKICDIITLLSNDDGSTDNNKQPEILYLVEKLLLKVHSNNLYVKLSSVRSLGNFSRYQYESNNVAKYPAKIIIKHMAWFINALEKSIKDNNSLMEVSILCLFKNLLYVTNFESMDENDKDNLIKTTIKVIEHTTYNPIVLKSLDIIQCIIKKGGMSEKQLVLYKSSNFIKLVTTYCDNVDEDLNKQAKQLLYFINEN